MTRRNIEIRFRGGGRFFVTPEEVEAWQGFHVERDDRRSAWFVAYGLGVKRWYGTFTDPLVGVGVLAERVRTSPMFRQLMEAQQ